MSPSRPQLRPRSNESRVAIVGLGYVGLSTAACLATKFHVTGIDLDRDKVRLVGQGIAPFREERLSPLLRKNINNGTLSCTTSFDATSGADFVFIAVGTPSAKSGEIDLTQVRSAAQSIGEAIATSQKRPVVIVKSTVIPGTSKTLVPVLEKCSGKACGEGFGVCSNPE